MSVSSLINHRVVDWDLTIGDWAELSRYLERRMGAERVGLLDTLQFANVSVDRAAVEQLLVDALGLSRLRRDIRRALEDMSQVLAKEPVRTASDGRRVGSAQIIANENRHELVVIDTVTGEEVSLIMNDAPGGAHMLDTTGWATLREPEALDAVIDWLNRERQRCWPGRQPKRRAPKPG